MGESGVVDGSGEDGVEEDHGGKEASLREVPEGGWIDFGEFVLPPLDAESAEEGGKVVCGA